MSEQDQTPVYPFCVTCHGTGGTHREATWSHPPYFEECPKCDGRTSSCDTDECWCGGRG